jgi:hypothetical protein
MTERPSAQDERARSIWNSPGGRYDEIARGVRR